jgi:hypothetical protein
MRRLPAAILVSVASHAAALGWIVYDGDVLAVTLREPLDRRPAPAAPAATPIDEPMAIVLLETRDEPAPTQPEPDLAAPTTAASGASRAPSRPAISTTTSGTAGAAGTPGTDETHRGPPGRSPYLTMRGPERPRIGGLSSTFLDRFLENSKPLAPPPDIPGERVGNELAEARRQLRRANQLDSTDVGRLRQRVIDLVKERDAEELKSSGGGTYRAEKDTFTAHVDADGRAHLEDHAAALDTQDRMMLGHGIDPYARNKLALLDRTRDQRVAVGERHRHVQLAHATELMQKNIDRLWSTARDLAARKQGLFELWDDCAETGSDDLVTGGAAARQLVVGVIRARLRGPDAYSAAELAALNAHRHSSAVFAPYD